MTDPAAIVPAVQNPSSWHVRERARLGCHPVQFIRIKRKAFVLARLGNACQFCGYARNAHSLAFHHVDPATKTMLLCSKSWQQHLPPLLDELLKCVLACHNCHGEIHDFLILRAVVAEKHAALQAALASLQGQGWADHGLSYGDVVNHDPF